MFYSKVQRKRSWDSSILLSYNVLKTRTIHFVSADDIAPPNQMFTTLLALRQFIRISNAKGECVIALILVNRN